MKKQLLNLIVLLLFSSTFAQVGINTTTPNAQLDIRSSNQATPANTDGILIPKIDAFPATNPTTAQNGMMVFLTTAVGVKPPGFYYWDSATTSWLGISGSANVWALAGNTGTVPGTDFLGTTDAKDFVFKTNSTERARFTSGGFLGIGITTPAQQLQITGNFRLPASTSTSGIIYSATNRLLHTNSGFFSGVNSGSLTATGYGNTGVGNDALTAITSGNMNSAFGNSSMSALTTGFSNTTFGYQSMLSTTTAGDNTAIGAQSLKANTTGSRNTTVGSFSMSGNLTGSDNVAMGYGALGGPLTGMFNSAIGNGAMSVNTSGFNNSAFGREALQSNTTGSRNTALGYGTLHTNIVGGTNTAVGTEAGYNTIGSGNVMLGYQAGYSEVGSNKLYIDNSNTVSPLIYGDFGTNLLRVNGTMNINNAYSFPTVDGTAGQSLTTDGAGSLTWAAPTGSDTSAWHKEGDTGTDPAINFLGTTDSKDLVIKTNATEVARFSANGNFGIGTNTPASQLHVKGGQIIESGSLYMNSGDNVEKIYLTDWGDNGSKINTSTNFTIDYIAGSNGWDTDGNHKFSTSAIGVGAVERMRLNSNGNLGIGTTVPQEKLHVIGNIRTSSLAGVGTRMVQTDDSGILTPMTAGTASQVLLGTGVWGSVPITSWGLTGNSGTTAGTNFIGTTDNQALDIRTNNTTRVRFTTRGQIETYNNGRSVFIGENSGANDDFSSNYNNFIGFNSGTSNTSGEYNLGVGGFALNNTTTASNNVALGNNSQRYNVTGFQNTSVGSESLIDNTANDNVAIGYFASRANTSGTSNTAVGTQAMVAGTTANNNTAVGYQSLQNNTSSGITGVGYQAVQNNTGIRTTGFGYRALKLNTTGSSNTAVGYDALSKNTTGGNNTALGSETMLNITTGSGNTGLGKYALLNTTTSTNNTAVGLSSMFSNSTGANNNALGFQALSGNTTGNNNVAMGNNALVTNTTGSNNTAVGFGADVLSVALSNATAIGYNAKVNANNSLILGGTGTDAVNVGIGTTVPAEELEVVGNIRTSSLAGTGTRVVQADANGTLTQMAAGTASQVLLGTGVWGTMPTTGWGINGNTGTNSGTDFLGTTDAVDFVFKTNNSERARFTSAGFMGIGTTAPQANLDITGLGTGTNSLLLRSGNNSTGFNSSQITFGYNGTIGYKHSIKSRHMSGADTGNAIDFTVWDYGTDAPTTIGTKTVMTIDGEGTGRVGIGTTTPATTLEVVGVARLTSAAANADLEFNTAARSTIYPNGSNTPANLNLQLRSKGSGILELNSDNSGNVQMVTGGGNVGVGTATPTQAKMVINGTQNSTLSYGYLNSGGSVGTSSGTVGYSVYASGRIAATEFNAFSDERIKNVIGVSNSTKDLETLNRIQITDYKFKDSIGKGTELNKKVIAQQIKKVYPQAVSVITDVIPDIYAITKIKDGRIILKNNLKKDDRVRLIFDDRTEMVTILQADENGFTVDLKDNGKVFVYGREVKDFHTVDYEALSTLNISATQELIKIISQQETQIRELKADNSDMNKRLAKSESDITEIKNMLKIGTSDNYVNKK